MNNINLTTDIYGILDDLKNIQQTKNEIEMLEPNDGYKFVDIFYADIEIGNIIMLLSGDYIDNEMRNDAQKRMNEIIKILSF